MLETVYCLFIFNNTSTKINIMWWADYSKNVQTTLYYCLSVYKLSVFLYNLYYDDYYKLEIRLPQNLAKVDLVIYGLFVTSNFKASVVNQGPKAIHIVHVILYMNVLLTIY